MKRRAFFFRIGEFSLINDAVVSGLRCEFADVEWSVVDVERDIVRPLPMLYARATAEAMLRYGGRILSNRQPPRDFFPRLPVVIAAVRQWVREHVNPADTAFIFQTQSLFDASHPAVPHFLYTDHTYLANLRYAEPKPLLPVADAWLEMERDLYKRANCSFAASRFAALSIREDYGVPEARVVCVLSGGNVAVGDEVALERTGRVILFVGVDWERKGGPELLAAFRTVRAKVPGAELWIVGCEPAMKEAGVKILGRIPPGDVADCYRKADVFCVPSRVEPAGAVFSEAAAHGLPVVATRVGGIPDRVEDGITGFLSEPALLAERLERLLSDPELRARFGAAGRVMARERFTWAAVCGRMAARMRKEVEL
jgi:glycosyltransferase involved in cell wall biosynthesis